MIIIYHTDSNLVRRNNKLDNLLQKLPEALHKRAHRYKFEKDSYDFVIGRLLLQRALKDFDLISTLEEVGYLESGKPYLENVHFNISHTEGLVVCAISTEGEIGIDVEKVKEIGLKDFEAWFTTQEWRDIHKASSPIDKFYWYWTRKESIIKALGVNLSYLHKIELDVTRDSILVEGKKWYLKDLDFGEDFTGALCIDRKTGLSSIGRKLVSNL